MSLYMLQLLVLLVHLISQRVAHRNSRREIRAEISVHDHHFGSDFMGIVDSQFTRFDRIVGKVYRYQYLLFLMTGFFLFKKFNNRRRQ